MAWCQEYYEHCQRPFQGRKDKYCCPVYVNQARWGEVSLDAGLLDVDWGGPKEFQSFKVQIFPFS